MGTTFKGWVENPMADAGAGGKAEFRELAVVSLIAPLEVRDRRLPVGARGTIVHVYRDGEAFEVEFQRPFHCVTTVDRSLLRA